LLQKCKKKIYTKFGLSAYIMAVL